MSTRSVTIIRQTEYWDDKPDTTEIMRFYRHCGGYPEGHGLEMARAIKNLDREGGQRSYWLAGFLRWFLMSSPYAQYIEFEDASLASDLLPTQAGFFFGDTDYDESYWRDLEFTKEQLERILGMVEGDGWGWHFTGEDDWDLSIMYHASW